MQQVKSPKSDKGAGATRRLDREKERSVWESTLAKLMSPQLRMDSYLDILYEADREIIRGKRSNGERTLRAIRPPAYKLVQTPASGPPVKRKLSLLDDNVVKYRSPFSDVVGTTGLILHAEISPSSTTASTVFHSHLGEEFAFVMDDGEVEVEIIRGKGRKFGSRFERYACSKRVGKQSLWFKSELPHFAHATSKVKMLLCFADPVGERALIGDAEKNVVGFGTRNITDQDEDVVKQAAASGVVGRISRARILAGLSISGLADKIKMGASHLSRIESGDICPTVYTAKRIAEELRAALTDILPDDVSDCVHGLWSNASTGPGPTPYRWKDHGDLRVLLAGSPLGKVLVPMFVPIGEQNGNLESTLGIHNMHSLEKGGFRDYPESLVIYVLDGQVNLEVHTNIDKRFPDGANIPELVHLKKGNLVHLRTGHRHRFVPLRAKKARKYESCNLLCVLWRNLGFAQTALECLSDEELGQYRVRPRRAHS